MSQRFHTFSLRIRLTLLLALALLVVFGAAAKIVDWRADTEMQQRFDASLLARAQSLASLTQIEGGSVEVGPENTASAVFTGIRSASWYALRCGGRTIARTATIPPPVATGSQPTFADAQLADGQTLRVVGLRFVPMADDNQTAASGGPTCSLRYALNRGPLDEILDTLDFILLGSLLGACALVIMVTPWLVRRGLRPLAVLDRAMAGIGPDTPEARLPASDTAELAPLVARFDEVLARMDEGLARERQFASGLAHEFRTRLAELRTLVDVEMRYPSGRGMPALLGEIANIGSELEATVAALLQLTRIQSGLERTSPEQVPLPTLLARVFARHHDTAHARDVCLESDVDCDPPFMIETDPALLEIVLDNLLGNAIAYAPQGTLVRLRATQKRLVVDNLAPALHPDDLANLGRRFWRKNAQGSDHAGLGLALAGAAARALGMDLSFGLADGVLHATLQWTTQACR